MKEFIKDYSLNVAIVGIILFVAQLLTPFVQSGFFAVAPVDILLSDVSFTASDVIDDQQMLTFCRNARYNYTGDFYYEVMSEDGSVVAHFTDENVSIEKGFKCVPYTLAFVVGEDSPKQQIVFDHGEYYLLSVYFQPAVGVERVISSIRSNNFNR